jgi:dTDP-4-dehydrorhamnose reductase
MIWLIGSKGMLGTEIFFLLEKTGLPFIGTDHEVDITDTAALEKFAENQSINWIINCAAYTAVDKAEDDVENCRKLNTLGSGNIAACAKKIGAHLIHISTDYVFDGKGIKADGTDILRPYREDDATAPIGIYGRTKRDGEIAVLENNPYSYIIRTAWLYGKYGNNFVHTMLRLMNERDEVKVVDDQRGSPTWTFDLAKTIITFIKTEKSGKNVPYGIYHFTNEGEITWFDFAREIYEQARKLGILKKDCEINPCTSVDFPAKVKRPAFSALDKSKIKTTMRMEIPTWDKSLKDFLQDHDIKQ